VSGGVEVHFDVARAVFSCTIQWCSARRHVLERVGAGTSFAPDDVKKDSRWPRNVPPAAVSPPTGFNLVACEPTRQTPFAQSTTGGSNNPRGHQPPKNSAVPRPVCAPARFAAFKSVRPKSRAALVSIGRSACRAIVSYQRVTRCSAGIRDTQRHPFAATVFAAPPNDRRASRELLGAEIKPPSGNPA